MSLWLCEIVSKDGTFLNRPKFLVLGGNPPGQALMESFIEGLKEKVRNHEDFHAQSYPFGFEINIEVVEFYNSVSSILL